MRVSETYLYKIHSLKTSVDKAFDQTLRCYAGITLSQFMLLLAVMEHGTVNQRTVAQFLHVSPAAVNRQVEIVKRRKWLHVDEEAAGRGQALTLTHEGEVAIEKSIAILDRHVFNIFVDADRQTNLMHHIDLLLAHTKGAVDEQSKGRAK